MEIELDFNVIECDKGHINSLDAVKCSVCGEIFDNIEFEQNHYENRKKRLSEVFAAITEKREQIRELKKNIRRNAVQLSRYENQNDFESTQLRLIEDANDNPIFTNLNLTSEIINGENFSKIEKNLIDFFNALYVPIINILTCDIAYFYRKNTPKRILKIAQQAENAYITFFESAIQKSLEEANHCQNKAQQMLDELTIETSIIGRIYTSQRIDNNLAVFEDGDNNYSVLAAMLMFNKPQKNIGETISSMKRDVSYYFKDFITKKDDEISIEAILSLNTYMNSSLIFTDEQRFFCKLKAALTLLNEVNVKQDSKLSKYIHDYKDTFIYMLQKMMDIQISAAFITSNNPSEKVLLYNMLKWYKDLCEGIYRDTAILLYLCCCIIKDQTYETPIFNQCISFSDIESRFDSLTKKYKLGILTDGVNKIARHAEAHVDYEVDYDCRIIYFKNKKKGLTENVSFDDFIALFDKLMETISSMICSYELFMINNGQYSTLFNEIHDELQNDINANQVDIAPLLRGIVVEGKSEYIENGQQILSISGVCIDKDSFDGYDSLLSIFYTISKFEPKYDHIILNVKNLECTTEMSTKFFKKLDLSKEQSVYLLGVIKYLFSRQYIDEKEEAVRFHDMYYNFFEKYLKQVLKLKDLKKLCYIGKPFPSVLINHCNELIIDSEYIVSILEEIEEELNDNRLNIHCLEIIKNMQRSLRNILAVNLFTASHTNIFKTISEEALRIIDVFSFFRNTIDKETFYNTKTTAGINKFKNIRRNDECPCGSKKKYKKCCGRNIL